jgi:hypothetical protein
MNAIDHSDLVLIWKNPYIFFSSLLIVKGGKQLPLSNCSEEMFINRLIEKASEFRNRFCKAIHLVLIEFFGFLNQLL